MYIEPYIKVNNLFQSLLLEYTALLKGWQIFNWWCKTVNFTDVWGHYGIWKVTLNWSDTKTCEHAVTTVSLAAQCSSFSLFTLYLWFTCLYSTKNA